MAVFIAVVVFSSSFSSSMFFLTSQFYNIHQYNMFVFTNYYYYFKLFASQYNQVSTVVCDYYTLKRDRESERAVTTT